VDVVDMEELAAAGANLDNNMVGAVTVMEAVTDTEINY